MNSMTVDGHIRSMKKERFEKFVELLDAEIESKEKNNHSEAISLGANDNPTETERDAFWLFGIDLEALRMLKQITDQETERRSK